MSIYIDIASLWRGAGSTAPGGDKIVSLCSELIGYGEEIKDRGVETRECFVYGDEITEAERVGLQDLGFHVTVAGETTLEKMQTQIVMSLWDAERMANTAAGVPTVLVATSNPEAAGLLRQLRNRKIDVVLATELSGRPGRPPVGPELRETEKRIDWTRMVQIVEDNPAESPWVGGSADESLEPMLPDALAAPSRSLPMPIPGFDGGASGSLEPLVPPPVHMTPGHGRGKVPGNADIAPPSMGQKGFSTESFDSELGDMDFGMAKFRSELDGRLIRSASNAANLEMENREVTETLQAVRDTWHSKDTPALVRQLLRLIRNSFGAEAGDLICELITKEEQTAASSGSPTEPGTAIGVAFTLEVLQHLYDQCIKRQQAKRSQSRSQSRIEGSFVLISSLGKARDGSQPVQVRVEHPQMTADRPPLTGLCCLPGGSGDGTDTGVLH